MLVIGFCGFEKNLSVIEFKSRVEQTHVSIEQRWCYCIFFPHQNEPCELSWAKHHFVSSSIVGGITISLAEVTI